MLCFHPPAFMLSLLQNTKKKWIEKEKIYISQNISCSTKVKMFTYHYKEDAIQADGSNFSNKCVRFWDPFWHAWANGEHTKKNLFPLRHGSTDKENGKITGLTSQQGNYTILTCPKVQHCFNVMIYLQHFSAPPTLFFISSQAFTVKPSWAGTFNLPHPASSNPPT